MVSLIKHSISMLTVLVVIELIIDNRVDGSITVTKILAGKKKFKTFSLGLSFLPTLVKVKPNKFHFTIRQNQYVRPKKFKMDGSLPLKIPTIMMPKRNPYEPIQDIDIDADLSIGADSAHQMSYDNVAGASESIGVTETENELKMPVESENFSPNRHHSENYRNSISNRREMLNDLSMEPIGQQFFAPPSPFHLDRNDLLIRKFSKENKESDCEEISKRSEKSFSPEISLQISDPADSNLEESITKSSHLPMKINIGEHYDPSIIYMDEQSDPEDEDDRFKISPNQEKSWETDPLLDQDQSESINYYRRKPKKKDYGPDDIRIDFNLSGPHGGPKVPYGFGDDQDQLNRQLNRIQQHLPIGLHSKQYYNYYLRHNFGQQLKPIPYSYLRIKKIKHKFF
ncbi:B-type allatostatin [Sarcoptes scabiei]|nr:B-type allatostatin [Sarcoptes scabiei]